MKIIYGNKSLSYIIFNFKNAADIAINFKQHKES
jgi:hypothetical protein